MTLKTLQSQRGSKKTRHPLGQAGGKRLELVENDAVDDMEVAKNLENYLLGVEI